MNKFRASAPPPFLFWDSLSSESACPFLISCMPQAYSGTGTTNDSGGGGHSRGWRFIQSVGDNGTQCLVPWSRSLLVHLSSLVFVRLSNTNHHTPTTVAFLQFRVTVTSLRIRSVIHTVIFSLVCFPHWFSYGWLCIFFQSWVECPLLASLLEYSI